MPRLSSRHPPPSPPPPRVVVVINLHGGTPSSLTDASVDHLSSISFVRDAGADVYRRLYPTNASAPCALHDIIADAPLCSMTDSCWHEWSTPMRATRTLFDVVKTHGYETHLLGAYGLDSRFDPHRMMRDNPYDLEDALQDVGVDRFESEDAAFSCRSAIAHDKATIDRARLRVEEWKTSPSSHKFMMVNLLACQDVHKCSWSTAEHAHSTHCAPQVPVIAAKDWSYDLSASGAGDASKVGASQLSDDPRRYDAPQGTRVSEALLRKVMHDDYVRGERTEPLSDARLTHTVLALQNFAWKTLRKLDDSLRLLVEQILSLPQESTHLFITCDHALSLYEHGVRCEMPWDACCKTFCVRLGPDTRRAKEDDDAAGEQASDDDDASKERDDAETPAPEPAPEGSASSAPDPPTSTPAPASSSSQPTPWNRDDASTRSKNSLTHWLLHACGIADRVDWHSPLVDAGMAITVSLSPSSLCRANVPPAHEDALSLPCFWCRCVVVLRGRTYSIVQWWSMHDLIECGARVGLFPGKPVPARDDVDGRSLFASKQTHFVLPVSNDLDCVFDLTSDSAELENLCTRPGWLESEEADLLHRSAQQCAASFGLTNRIRLVVPEDAHRLHPDDVSVCSVQMLPSSSRNPPSSSRGSEQVSKKMFRSVATQTDAVSAAPSPAFVAPASAPAPAPAPAPASIPALLAAASSSSAPLSAGDAAAPRVLPPPAPTKASAATTAIAESAAKAIERAKAANAISTIAAPRGSASRRESAMGRQRGR